MKKNVIIICTSPRRNGNSTLLAEQFALGAGEAGHNVETFYLSETEPGFCRGCYYCVSHNGQCFQNDIMNEIHDKLISADTIVFATPIYFYEMAGQMKTFIDRCVAFYTKLRAREVYLLATSWDPKKGAMDGAIKGLQGFVDCFETDAKIAGIVYGTGSTDAGDVRHTPAFEEAYTMGKNI